MTTTRSSSNSFVRLLLPLTLLLAILGGLAWVLRPVQPSAIGATLTVNEALTANDTAGFARAIEPRAFNFPADHGAHPGFQTEWWYYTGNLDSADGRHWGFQLTFFRRALAPEAAERASKLATSNIYMAHFALTDVGGNQFYAFDRFTRDGGGLAGAEGTPFHVWTGSWQASGDPESGTRLQASAENVAIDLVARSTKPPVLQGDNGLSQKSSGTGNASYYYSLTRMATDGTITVDGTTYNVSGLLWKDREWSTSVLKQDQVGWDWFALQLEDGRELMYYQIRLQDGTLEPLSSGTLIAADGTSIRIARDQIQIEVLDRWTSPGSGAQYPSRWRVRVPSHQLDLTIEPYIAQQELPFSVTYWEGAVRVDGTSNNQPIAGNGYVEMTGYTDQQRSVVESRSP